MKNLNNNKTLIIYIYIFYTSSMKNLNNNKTLISKRNLAEDLILFNFI